MRLFEQEKEEYPNLRMRKIDYNRHIMRIKQKGQTYRTIMGGSTRILRKNVSKKKKKNIQAI